MLALVLSAGCASFTDPAVRLANCLGRGARATGEAHDDTTVTCDFRLEGPCVVVLHPSGQLSKDDYDRAGLGKMRTELLSLRLGEREGIYVLPLDGQVLPSRTTSQGRSVHIPRLFTKRYTDSVATLTLRRTERGVEVVALD